MAKSVIFGLGLGLCLALGLGPIRSEAAIPYRNTLTMKKNTYVKQGVFVGGKAGEGSSLLNVRRTFSKKLQTERVVIDLGDEQMRPDGLDLGYFQASMDAKNNRVILDLAQLKYSKISERQVQNLFRKSPLVASVSLTFDPEDKTGTLVLNLKRPSRLEVFRMLDKKKPGRVVMDLVPLREG